MSEKGGAHHVGHLMSGLPTRPGVDPLETVHDKEGMHNVDHFMRGDGCIGVVGQPAMECIHQRACLTEKACTMWAIS